jgi:hypothetical protein
VSPYPNNSESLYTQLNNVSPYSSNSESLYMQLNNVSPYPSNSESLYTQLKAMCQVQCLYFSLAHAIISFSYQLPACYSTDNSHVITNHIHVDDAVSKPCGRLMHCTCIQVDVMSGPCVFVSTS